MPIFTLNPSSSNNNRKKLRLEREIHFTGVGRILGTAEEVGARKRKRSDDEEGDEEYLPAQDAGKDEDEDGDGDVKKEVGKCERKGDLGSYGEMGRSGGGEEGKEKQEAEKDVERVREGEAVETKGVDATDMKGVYNGEDTSGRPLIGFEVRRCKNREIPLNHGNGRKKVRYNGMAIDEEMLGGVGGNEEAIARGSLRSGVKRGFWKYGEGRVLGSGKEGRD